MPSSALDPFPLEVSVLANASALLTVIGYIVEKARAANCFQKECRELTNISINLSMTFLDHSKELKDLRSSGDFQQCLKEVYSFVTQCRDWSILHVGWEVVSRSRFQNLKSRLDEVQRSFSTELLVSLEQQGCWKMPNDSTR
jgi:hypothetical protein